MRVDRGSMVKVPMLVFTVYGFWCPLGWPRKWKCAYYCYTVLASGILFIHMLTQLCNIIFNIDDLTGFATNCLSLMPTVDVCAKAINILVNRQSIVSLLNMFEKERCKVRDYREKSLQRKYEKLLGIVNKATIILTYATINLQLVTPFLRDWRSRQLPYMAWLPYATDNEMIFWFTYAYEIFSVPYVPLVEVAHVLLAISVMGQISLQLDLLSYRILHMAGNNFVIEDRCERRRKLVDCVNHHLLIFELGEATQQCFGMTFYVQTLVSLVCICTGAHVLARFGIRSAEFLSTFLFLACMGGLGFICCWFGNEVSLKSLDISSAVYKMNWTELETNFRKDLLNICLRAKRPITFTCGPALKLSNSVFMGVLQTAYTAFTVLQQAIERNSHQNSIANKT